jgi:1-pyrroline-5-carboxylate dehydrogenase
MTSSISFNPATNGVFSPPPPHNEPVLEYTPGSPMKGYLKLALEEMANREADVPMRIGGESVRSSDLGEIRAPHDHRRVLGRFHKADNAAVDKAIAAALEAKHDWARTPWQDRVAIFLRAAELLSEHARCAMNAATMLGQSKTVQQAEIDASCELIDFLRFNAHFAHRLYSEQPHSGPAEWNRTDYRPLEGFVYAVTPFNFTAIAANLPSCPAMLGNTVVWKPASTAMLSAHYIMTLFREAGLPPGVINMVGGSGELISNQVLASRDLAGIHFTGSTPVFQDLWKAVGNNIANYRTYPRLVGETGGKDFVVAHTSAEQSELVAALIRGSFEYQGQKCSASSRAYIAQSVWDGIKDELIEETNGLTMGDVSDFRYFMGAVIDASAFKRITGYIDRAAASDKVEVIAGGDYDDEQGYFIRPTILLTTDPNYETMEQELFGPVLTVYVYPDKEYDEVLDLCDRTSPYALTGAIFARDRQAILKASDRLLHAAGNFYINDKPTGAVVGRQPFGGGRASGTNDKAGSLLNLLRWISPRTIKENLRPPLEHVYFHQLEA